MDLYILEWGGLLLRWLHVIAAIGWIGSSFFFMHLDASLRAHPDIPAGKGGVSWQVHGGGFYEMKKYLVAPAKMPEELTWHKWQSYWTWLSGFFLLGWVYYAQASLYLIDPAVMKLSVGAASAIGVCSLVAGWIFYDVLCRSKLGKNETLLAALGMAFVVAMSFLYTNVFSGRGALIHIGALMATMMTANVAMIIIPNTRKSVAALTAGNPPDPAWGKQAKQRSTHNNYITLPVLFLMLANHYPLTYASNAMIPYLVALILPAGALMRLFYNVRHNDHAKSPWWMLVVSSLLIIAAATLTLFSAPGFREKWGLKPLAQVESAEKLTAAQLPPQQVVDILTSRCSMCHAAEPVWDGIHMAPKGVRLDTPESMAKEADSVRLFSVLTHAMPPNNITEMTREERQQLALWLEKKD